MRLSLRLIRSSYLAKAAVYNFVAIADDVRYALTVEANFPGLDLAPNPIASALVFARLLFHRHDSLRELFNLLVLLFELRISVSCLSLAELLILVLVPDLGIFSSSLAAGLQDVNSSALGGYKSNKSHAQFS